MKSRPVIVIAIQTFLLVDVSIDLCTGTDTCDEYFLHHSSAVCSKFEAKKIILERFRFYHNNDFLATMCYRGDTNLTISRSSSWSDYTGIKRLVLYNCTLDPYSFYDKFSQVISISYKGENPDRILKNNAFRRQCKALIVNLSSSKIQIVEPLAFNCMNSVQRVYLYRNQIEVLPPEVFRGMEELSKLDLSYNKMVTLPTGIFYGLKSLLKLDLKNNMLEKLGDIFFRNSNLETLDLSNNKITSISKGVFVETKRLRILNLSGNRLQVITLETLGDLVNVGILHLAFNDIVELKDQPFRNNSKLNILDLRGNKLSQMRNGDFSGLTSLNILYMSSNVIENMSMNALQGVPNLEYLDLSSNLLATFPTSDTQSVFSQAKLWYLSLADNRLGNVSLPKIFRDTRFRHLHLSGNAGLTLNNDSFAGLSRLSQLFMDGCNITTIPERLFENTPSLSLIRMRNNNIGAIEPNTFVPLKFLYDLDLSYNKIKKLNRSPCLGILTIANFSNNNIVQIESGFFPVSTRSLDLSSNFVSYFRFDDLNLEFLNLSHNLISSLQGIIKPGTHLKKVDVSYNNLREITEEEWKAILRMSHFTATDNSVHEIILPENLNVEHSGKIHLERNDVSRVSLPDNIQNLTKPNWWSKLDIYISGNAMNCDCFASKLYEYLKNYKLDEHYLEFVGEWICDRPLEVYGKNLVDLEQTDLKCDFTEENSRF